MPLSKIDSASLNSPITAVDLAYTGTLTGNGGIVNIGSGQVYKDASGNVGIGTSSPAQKLDVVGSIKLNGTLLAQANNGINFNSGVDSNSIITTVSASGYMQYTGFNGHIFSTSTGGVVERARIDSSGNLLVGTTSPIGASKVSVLSGSTNATTYTTVAATGGSTMYQQQQSTSGVSTAAVIILNPGLYASMILVFGSDGTNRFQDTIVCGLGTGTIGVISSFTISGAPSSRAYSQSSSTYRVAMGSGTYTIQTGAFSFNG